MRARCSMCIEPAKQLSSPPCWGTPLSALPLAAAAAALQVICSSQNDRGGNFSFGCGYWRSYYRLDSDTAAACANYVPAEGVPPPDQANLAPFAQFAQRLNQAVRG